jgi:hypothetical protein
VVPVVMPATFSVAVMMTGAVIGRGEMTAGAVLMSMFHHGCDIDHDISKIKIYLILESWTFLQLCDMLFLIFN